MIRQMHLAEFMIASQVIHSHAVWRHPNTQPGFLDAEYYQKIGQVLERGKFDLWKHSFSRAQGIDLLFRPLIHRDHLKNLWITWFQSYSDGNYFAQNIQEKRCEIIFDYRNGVIRLIMILVIKNLIGFYCVNRMDDEI